MGMGASAARGINDSGQIVGRYTDAAGVIHGFRATPVAIPEPSTVLLFGIGIMGLIG
jgi:probable HAF family extracellular repeat protein